MKSRVRTRKQVAELSAFSHQLTELINRMRLVTPATSGSASWLRQKNDAVYASDDSSLKQDPKAPLNVVVKRFIFLWDLKSHEHPLPIRTSGTDRIGYISARLAETCTHLKEAQHQTL